MKNSLAYTGDSLREIGLLNKTTSPFLACSARAFGLPALALRQNGQGGKGEARRQMDLRRDRRRACVCAFLYDAHFR